MIHGENRKINTTLGDLISAVSDAAFEVCGDKKTAYLLAGMALEEILLKDSCQSGESAGEGRRPSRTIRSH